MDAVARFQWFNAFGFAFAWIPVMYPFFTGERGFSNREFFALNAAYYLTMCVFELPTGLLADRFGRKTVLVLGSFGFALSFAVVFAAGTFSGALCGMVLMGVAHTLISGADAAWLYDKLLEEGRAAEYLKIEGRAHWMRMIGVSVSDLLGGVAAQYASFGAAFAVAVVFTMVAGSIALTLPEPPRHIRTGPIAKQLLDDLKLSFAHAHVRWILLYSTVLFLLLRVAFHLYQPHLAEIGIHDYAVYGALFAVLNLAAAPFAIKAHDLHRRFGERALAALLPLLMGASFLLLHLFPVRVSIVFFALQQAPYGLMNPVTRSYTNRHVSSADRATVFSVQSLAGRLAFGAFALAIGESFERAGAVGPLYPWLGAGAIAATFVLLWTMPRDAEA